MLISKRHSADPPRTPPIAPRRRCHALAGDLQRRVECNPFALRHPGRLDGICTFRRPPRSRRHPAPYMSMALRYASPAASAESCRKTRGLPLRHLADVELEQPASWTSDERAGRPLIPYFLGGLTSHPPPNLCPTTLNPTILVSDRPIWLAIYLSRTSAAGPSPPSTQPAYSWTRCAVRIVDR